MLSPPIQLDSHAALPLYQQIERQLRDAILEGLLRPGARLPSIRELAAQLRVARITVATAYEQLAAEGYVEGRVGAGTIVTRELPTWLLVQRQSRAHRRRSVAGERRFPAMNPHAFASGFFEGSNPFVRDGARFDFTTGSTDLDLFPVSTWERMLKTAWRQLSSEGSRQLTTYHSPLGDPLLREAMAHHLGSSRAVRTDPENVVITSGAQGAIRAAVQLWLSPNQSYVVEDPGAPHLWRTLQVASANRVAVPVDRFGMRVDALPERAALALVTPSWQYPAGGTLPLARRLKLLAWAAEAGAIVIEDDCDSEMRYAGHSLPSLQGLDQDGRVLYVGTFSKVMFPGLRSGYAVVSDALRSRFGAMVEASDRGPANVEQRALALFVMEGHFERHLRRLRTAFRERQAAMVEAIRRELGGLLAVTAAPAGTHLVARITDPDWNATDIAGVAADAGILLEPMSLSCVRPAPDRELLIHYARHAPHAIDAGVQVLAAALARPRRQARPA